MGVRKQVDAFLEEHDSGLTGAENAAAKGIRLFLSHGAI
jgi:hypothetical protein